MSHWLFVGALLLSVSSQTSSLLWSCYLFRHSNWLSSSLSKPIRVKIWWNIFTWILRQLKKNTTQLCSLYLCTVIAFQINFSFCKSEHHYCWHCAFQLAEWNYIHKLYHFDAPKQWLLLINTDNLLTLNPKWSKSLHIYGCISIYRCLPQLTSTNQIETGGNSVFWRCHSKEEWKHVFYSVVSTDTQCIWIQYEWS